MPSANPCRSAVPTGDERDADRERGTRDTEQEADADQHPVPVRIAEQHRRQTANARRHVNTSVPPRRSVT
jgi:hypothetical protein